VGVFRDCPIFLRPPPYYLRNG